MKIAYCSPFSPIKSGISDFSEELVQELKKHIDIDLIYDVPISASLKKQFNCYHISKLDDVGFATKYDEIVYQMGNNYKIHNSIGKMIMHIPGIIELHDLSLHNYLAMEKYLTREYEEYVDIIKHCHGEKGVKIVRDFLNGNARAPWETHPIELNACRRFVEHAKGVIVHSDLAKQTVKAIIPDMPVVNIPLFISNIRPVAAEKKKLAKKQLGISETCYVFGSFGFITAAKRILPTLEALSQYKEHDFRYVVIGEELEKENPLADEIRRLGLNGKVIVTGYLPLDEYQKYMQACDICINLRYPTCGESSANLQRILGMGIPCIVTDIGTFSEYPDSCTVKVSYGENEVGDILAAIRKLTSDGDTYKTFSQSAVGYMQENADIEKCCRQYVQFFSDVSAGAFVERDMADRMLDKAIAEGFTEEGYLLELVKRCI